MPGYRSPFNRAAAAVRAAGRTREPRDIDLLMMRALIKGDMSTALLLIDRGGDPNFRNQPGETPLMAAALRSDPSIIQALLDRGADVNAQDAEGNTVLHWLARAEWAREIPAIAHQLLDAGANAALQNNRGETAGYMASKLGKARLARILDVPGEHIEVVRPIKLKTAPKPEPEPEIEPEANPEPVVAAPPPPPPAAKPVKSETISEMEKRYAKAGLFG